MILEFARARKTALITIGLTTLAIPLLVGVFNTRPASAQPATTEKFESISIKPNHSGNTENNMRTSPGRLAAENVTPHNLLLYAFGMAETRLFGEPDWVSKEKFDVTAVTGTSIEFNRTTLQPYLQSLFADRFQLKYHREDREFPIFSLVVAKGGPRLTASPVEGASSTGIHANAGKNLLNAKNVTMKRLAEVLSQQSDRFVLDHTGLTGQYDFNLAWSSDLTSDDAQEPALFTAVQQLGLKLEPAKGPVEVVVIDHIERPTPN